MECIYSIWGRISSGTTAKCAMYNVQFNQWKEMATLSTPRHNCAAILVSRKWIYAIAGFGNDYLDSVERYSF